MNEPLGQALGVLFATLFNHLWQSTLFLLVIAGLAMLLRRNNARVRYVLWLVASLKFLVPFALLAMLGTLIPWQPGVGDAAAVAPRVLDLAGNIAAPLTGNFPYPQIGANTRAMSPAQWALVVLAMVWVMGTLIVAARWAVRWFEIERALWSSVKRTGIDFPARVRTTTRQFEPGVVGNIWPVLLLPAGIEERLTAAQLQAVLAHERCHLRWRDNFAAWLHMLVEMLFWFFPPVWWIGARLIEERERACDEQVTREGHAPASYAEGILAVCEHYIASRLPCVSGVSGADLRKRIERILKNAQALQLDRPRKLALATIACCAVAVPIGAGMVSGNAVQMLLASAYSAAHIDYLRLQSVHARNLTDVWSAGRGMCSAPTPAFFRQRKTLAAAVARLSAGDGEKVLLFAVAANSTADVRRLLAAGASRSGDGFLKSNSLMHIAAEYADVPMLDLLAQTGFSIDERGSGGIGIDGATPLIAAISRGRLDNADWLIRQGADVSAADQSGTTALVHAMVTCRDRELTQRLINAGALPNDKARRIARNLGVRIDAAPLRTAANVVPPPVAKEEPRQQWLTPDPKDLQADDFRSRSPTGYAAVTADFDGDGKPDRAELRVDPSGRQEGLFMQFSSVLPDVRQPAYSVAHRQHSLQLLMGVSLARPGTYVTACGKGYGRCGADEPREVVLKHPGIDYFMPESASSLIFWDETTRQLRRVWTSD